MARITAMCAGVIAIPLGQARDRDPALYRSVGDGGPHRRLRGRAEPTAENKESTAHSPQGRRIELELPHPERLQLHCESEPVSCAASHAEVSRSAFPAVRCSPNAEYAFTSLNSSSPS